MFDENEKKSGRHWFFTGLGGGFKTIILTWHDHWTKNFRFMNMVRRTFLKLEITSFRIFQSVQFFRKYVFSNKTRDSAKSRCEIRKVEIFKISVRWDWGKNLNLFWSLTEIAENVIRLQWSVRKLHESVFFIVRSRWTKKFKFSKIWIKLWSWNPPGFEYFFKKNCDFAPMPHRRFSPRRHSTVVRSLWSRTKQHDSSTQTWFRSQRNGGFRFAGNTECCMDREKTKDW